MRFLADGQSRDCPAPGPSKPEPEWLVAFRAGDFKLFDRMLEAARWSRPVGRWYRLLLLIAGDVERHPGPSRHDTKDVRYTPRDELNLLGGLSQATSQRMQRCLELFEERCKVQAGITLATALSSAEVASLALRGYGLTLFREGKPRYLLVYTIAAIQQLRPDFRRQLAGAWQVDYMITHGSLKNLVNVEPYFQDPW